MADSRSSLGARPVTWISCCWSERQLSFDRIKRPALSRSSMKGSMSRPGTGAPPLLSEGPIPRTTMRLERSPLMIKPAIEMLSPVSTRARPEMLTSWTLAGVGCGVEVAVAVAVAVAVGEAVAVAPGVVVAVAVGDAVAVAPAVAVAVAVGVAVGVFTGVAVGVGEAVAVRH